MTFTEIVQKVADRLNLTATTALTRIGQEVNERYRETASSVGMATTVRGTATAPTIVGNRSLVFTCTKIFSVYNAAYDPPVVLDERTFDTLRNVPAGTDPAQQYAIQLMGASTVTIYLNSTPATIYTLTADVETNLTDLSGSQVPAFSADFHDILVHGALADELDKMEKYPLSAKQELKFQRRLSDLRLFIAKSAYLDIHQGARSRGRWTSGTV